jgi:hypothetical protein
MNDEGWTTVGGGDSDQKMWDRSAPITGRYVGRQDGVGRNKSKIYTLELEDGSEVGVWGSTVLDTKFESIPPQALVRLEHMGLATSKTGGQYHDFKVQYRVDEAAKQRAAERDETEQAEIEKAVGAGAKLDPNAPINLDDIPF